MNNQAVTAALAALPSEARVLDCGGWFDPLPQATHVVDLMPYATRGCKLRLDPLPGERFGRETWHQVDFLAPDLRLPFPDGFFDFVNCSHTIEDLADPIPLLREINRVGRAGALVTPSRLSEQTAGTRDRITSRQGHPHHHWICETSDGAVLLSHKSDALDGAWWRTAVPLRISERRRVADPDAGIWVHLWSGGFTWRVERGEAAHQHAVAFAQAAGATRPALFADLVVRQLRGLKYRLPGYRRPAATDWWGDMVKLSQPHSSLPLK